MSVTETTDSQHWITRFRQYGALRTYFKNHERDFEALRRSLNQAHIGVPYDVYLTRITLYSVVAVFAGLLLGVTASVAFAPAITSLSLGLTVPEPIAGVLASDAFAFAAVTLTAAATTGATTWSSLYYLPRFIADQRARSIDHNLPHAVVFMYALSYGGMNLIEVMRRIADSEDVYGEVSGEFRSILRDMDYFGTELPLAVQNARGRTPSQGFRDFMDDLVNVIDSGGDITAFFREESKKSLERAESQQRDFIESLAVMSEIYATVFIVAPLLFIVMLLVMSLIGASTLSAVTLLVYFAIPAGMAAFVYTVHTMAKPYGNTTSTLHIQDDAPETTNEEIKEYRRRKLRVDLRDVALDPIRSVKQKPLLSLIASIPTAVITVLLFAPPYRMTADPIGTTTAYVVVPTLIAFTPYAVLHELKQYRRQKLVRRFPDKLQALANANEMGLSFTESLKQISRRSTGVLADEFRKLSNDIRWNADTSRAMQEFANRLRVPQITRTSKLIAEASRSTADLSRILDSAAEDTLNQYRLAKERYRQMSGYIAIIMVSYLVYLSVVLLLEVAYLTPISEAMTEVNLPSNAFGGQYSGFFEVSVTTYRMVFYHSALIQGFGNGLLAGVMGKGNLASGLKYSLIFTALTAVAFILV